MAIAMQRFGSEGQLPGRREPRTELRRHAVFQVQCHYCGYEPQSVTTAPEVCPKCHGGSWERFARPRSILEHAEEEAGR